MIFTASFNWKQIIHEVSVLGGQQGSSAKHPIKNSPSTHTNSTDCLKFNAPMNVHANKLAP